MEASAKFSSTLDTPLVDPFAVSKNTSNPSGVVSRPQNGHGASRGDSNQTGFDSEVPTVSKEVQAEKRIDEDKCANRATCCARVYRSETEEASVVTLADPQQHFQPIIRGRKEALPALSAVQVPEPVTFPHSPERAIPKYPQNLKQHFQPGMCFADRCTDCATCRSQDTRGVAEVYFQDHSSGFHPTAHVSQHVAAVDQLNTLQSPIHFQCAQPPMQSESISFWSDPVTAPCYRIEHIDPARAVLLAMLRL
ncbi:hypothetical protein GGU11DRAFT_746852 [Lentinula aff. detonsa]|nr:hypothetical protein GGU11DRAFT_746852 [Lentinula aff. detonsa]